MPEIIILAVNDSSIESVSNEIAVILGKKLENIWVVHCSGVMPVSILSACSKQGAKTGCIHPFQTFYSPHPKLIKDIGWTIDTKHNPKVPVNFIKQIGGKPFLIPKGRKNAKILHHLSAVFVSNFFSTIISNAGELESLAGLKWNKFFPQIINTTLKNNLKSLSGNNKFPLTGPIARGEITTIKEQLKSLKNNSTLLNTYIYMSLATLETAKKRKLITKQKFAEIKEILVTSLNG